MMGEGRWARLCSGMWRQAEIRQDNTRPDKTTKDWTRQDETIQDKTRQRQGKARDNGKDWSLSAGKRWVGIHLPNLKIEMISFLHPHSCNIIPFTLQLREHGTVATWYKCLGSFFFFQFILRTSWLLYILIVFFWTTLLLHPNPDLNP